MNHQAMLFFQSHEVGDSSAPQRFAELLKKLVASPRMASIFRPTRDVDVSLAPFRRGD